MSRVAAWEQELHALVLSQGLSPRLAAGAQRAEQAAVPTCTKWGEKPKGGGGYYWATYKARIYRVWLCFYLSELLWRSSRAV